MNVNKMKPIGNKIIQLNDVDSTNNFTANLLKQGNLDNGTVIMADNQYAGRGQRGSTWYSDSGMNLICSIFVRYDNLSVEKQFYITQWVSISLIALMNRYGLNAKIKWPNDILINNRKVTGVLIENQINSSGIQSSIIGVGMNVNQKHFTGYNATSLTIETNVFYTVKDVLLAFIEELNESMHLIENQKFDELNTMYHEQLWMKDVQSSFSIKDIKYSGVIIGVTPTGQLKVRIENEEKEFDLKEIQFNL